MVRSDLVIHKFRKQVFVEAFYSNRLTVAERSFTELSIIISLTLGFFKYEILRHNKISLTSRDSHAFDQD